MSQEYMRLQKCLECVRAKTDFVPKVALVLGSGLGAFADDIEIVATVKFSEVENLPVSTIEGHSGRFVFGYVGSVPVVIMQGRVHYYEGHSMLSVVRHIRLMKMLGAEKLILTNAAGGINEDFSPGDFMMIDDQIMNFVPSPLIGENVEEFGTRFPDMSDIYSKRLRNIVRNTAQKLEIPLQEGVYIQLTGPNYESPQEVKMCRILGADAVGMSTACEAVTAVHAGMEVCGLSFISNLSSGMSQTPLSHKEVSEMAEKTAPMFKRLITESILSMGEL